MIPDPTKPQRGRPPLPEGAAKDGRVVLRVEAGRKARWVKAAQRKQETLAAYVLGACDAEADRRGVRGR